MKNKCYPCTAFNFDYCKDDDNLVNLNGDKCYQYREDKKTYCANFTFSHNPLMC